MLTRNGICYDLKNSPYFIKLKECTLFFSSSYNKDRFLQREKEERSRINESLSNRFKTNINVDYLAFINLYASIEKRGFYILTKKKEEITCLKHLKFDGLNLKKKN